MVVSPRMEAAQMELSVANGPGIDELFRQNMTTLLYFIDNCLRRKLTKTQMNCTVLMYLKQASNIIYKFWSKSWFSNFFFIWHQSKLGDVSLILLVSSWRCNRSTSEDKSSIFFFKSMMWSSHFALDMRT